MTETPKVMEVNCETGEVIERPPTHEENAQRELDAAHAEQERLAQEAEAQRIADLKAAAKAKLVSGHPLTAEEADTLVL